MEWDLGFASSQWPDGEAVSQSWQSQRRGKLRGEDGLTRGHFVSEVLLHHFTRTYRSPCRGQREPQPIGTEHQEWIKTYSDPLL